MLVNFAGADEHAPENACVVYLFLPGAADTPQAHLSHGFDPGHFRSAPHDAAVAVENAVAFVTPIDMGIDVHHADGIPAIVGP